MFACRLYYSVQRIGPRHFLIIQAAVDVDKTPFIRALVAKKNRNQREPWELNPAHDISVSHTNGGDLAFPPGRTCALSLMQRHPCYHYTRLPVKCSTMEMYETRNKRPAAHPAAHLVKLSSSCWSTSSTLKSLKANMCGKRRMRKEKGKKVGLGGGGDQWSPRNRT